MPASLPVPSRNATGAPRSSRAASSSETASVSGKGQTVPSARRNRAGILSEAGGPRKPVSGLAAPVPMSSRSASSRASRTSEGRPCAAARNASASVGGTTRSTRVPPWGWTSEGISGLLRGLGGEAAVQAAFGLGEAAPASRAGVFSRLDRAGARSAADAGIAARVQRVGGDVALADARPDLFAGPGGERVHLDEAKSRVALHHARPGAVRGLVAADGRDPGVEQQHLGAERLDLAQVAAAIRRPLPQRRTLPLLLLGQGERRLDAAHADSVPALHLVPQLQRLREEQAGVEG